MPNFLDKIVKHKKVEIRNHKKILPIKRMSLGASNVRNFGSALLGNKVSIIAEIKKASPSKGLICNNFDYLKIAKEYEKSGAAAISVLTEVKYFLGNLKILKDVSSQAHIPILRKDFIIDPYQIYEARHFGADAILLIVNLLSKSKLSDFQKLAHDLGMSVLVEVHDKEELQIALECKSRIIGINNRNLKTFQVDIKTTLELISSALQENCILVSESGINSRQDIRQLKKAGANAVLIGESLMRAPNIKKKLKEFIL